MNDQMKKRLLRTFILSLIALVIGLVAGWMQVRNQSVTVLKKPSNIQAVAGLKLGGDFELVDHNGEVVSEEILKDSYSLIYFGFTYCPAICPTELQKISKALKTLEAQAPEVAEKIKPIFITVDPQRDTPEVLKDYISLFHPRLIGLSGSPEQIEHVKKLYRVFAKKVWEEGNNDYTVDHTSYIYLFSPDGNLIAMYRIQDKAEQMAEDIKALNGQFDWN